MKIQDKKSSSREDVREKLISATLNKLEETGVHGVRARDLAKQAGCAVGTIYNIFGDLDDLVLIASSRTINEFKKFAFDRFHDAKARGVSEAELLYVLTEAYVDFAKEHKNRWQANFEISFDQESDFYETYVTGQHQLLALMVSILDKIAVGGRDKSELLAIGRALWGSVHGIATLAMNDSCNPLPREKILEQCRRIIDPLVASLKVPPSEDLVEARKS